jgi:hypothetical protein
MKINMKLMVVHNNNIVRIGFGFVIGAIIILSVSQHWLAIMVGGVCGALASTALLIVYKIVGQNLDRVNEEIVNQTNIAKFPLFSRSQIYFIVSISALSVLCGPYFLNFTTRTFDFAMLGALIGGGLCKTFQLLRNKYTGGFDSKQTQ